MKFSQILSKPPPIGAGLRIARQAVALVVTLIAGAALLGYLLNTPQLYRPIAGGPASSPFTLLAILCLTLSVSWSGPSIREKLVHHLAGFCVLLITLVHLADALMGSSLISTLMPFNEVLQSEAAKGLSNEMGINTALMLALLAIALNLEAANLPGWSQGVGLIAMLLPTISLTGYLYGLDAFFGQMSVITACCGLLLSLQILSLSPTRGAVKAILSPNLGGRLARFQVVAGYLIPFAAGYIAIELLRNQAAGIFGSLVVLTTWFVLVLATVSAIIIERAEERAKRRADELEKAALLDPLTGLANRRHFNQISQHEIARAQRSQKGLWLLAIDLDHFKRINDTEGHAMGDRVLKEIAQVLQANVRRTDLVARTGGEEFVVLMPENNIHGATKVAEKLRKAILAAVIPGWTDIYQQVSASVGCAAWLGEETIEPLVQRADEALYQAKRSGRNRVQINDASNSRQQIRNVSF